MITAGVDVIMVWDADAASSDYLLELMLAEAFEAMEEVRQNQPSVATRRVRTGQASKGRLSPNDNVLEVSLGFKFVVPFWFRADLRQATFTGFP